MLSEGFGSDDLVHGSDARSSRHHVDPAHRAWFAFEGVLAWGRVHKRAHRPLHLHSVSYIQLVQNLQVHVYTYVHIGDFLKT